MYTHREVKSNQIIFNSMALYSSYMGIPELYGKNSAAVPRSPNDLSPRSAIIQSSMHTTTEIQIQMIKNMSCRSLRFTLQLRSRGATSLLFCSIAAMCVLFWLVTSFCSPPPCALLLLCYSSARRMQKRG